MAVVGAEASDGEEEALVAGAGTAAAEAARARAITEEKTFILSNNRFGFDFTKTWGCLMPFF